MRLPTQHGLDLGWVANEQFDFGGAVKLGVDAHHGFAGGDIDGGFVVGGAPEVHGNACALEGHADKVAHGFGAVGGQHEGVGFVRLQHAPHAFDVFFGIAPVAFGVEVAQLQHIKLAQPDFGHAVGNFSGHKFAATQRAFVVEQDATGAKNTVAFAVVDRHPVRIQLGHTVGTARVERGGFFLRNGLHFAKHLRGAGLVEADFGIDETHCFQQVQSADAGNVGGGGGLLKTDADKALRRQVVDFIGLDFLHQGNTGPLIGQVVLNQVQVRVRLQPQLGQAPEVDRAGAPVGAIHGVAFIEQQLGEVGTVLPGDASDEGSFLHNVFNSPMEGVALGQHPAHAHKCLQTAQCRPRPGSCPTALR